jgi:predicted nucleic acid-binding protein
MKLALNDLAATFKAHKESFEKGCMVDTNALFAAAFPLDHHNEWAEKVFDELHRLDIPIYTNLNIRSEFIELSRRVLIPEDWYSRSCTGASIEVSQNSSEPGSNRRQALKIQRPTNKEISRSLESVSSDPHA